MTATLNDLRSAFCEASINILDIFMLNKKSIEPTFEPEKYAGKFERTSRLPNNQPLQAIQTRYIDLNEDEKARLSETSLTQQCVKEGYTLHHRFLHYYVNWWLNLHVKEWLAKMGLMKITFRMKRVLKNM